MSEFIGRRVSVGFGVESTPGTSVAPAHWVKHMSLGFQRKNTRVENESALGRNEGVNDSAVIEEWAEGGIGGKVYDIAIGYPLYNIFGSLVTTTNADASATVKDHTFDVSTSNVAKTLTVSRVDPNSNRRHAMATLEEFNLEVEQGDWAMWDGDLQSLGGTTASDTPAYTQENSFTSKHLSLKLATNVAGLSGATAIPLKSVKLNIKRDVNKFFPVGSTVPSAIHTGKWTASGEFTLRYTDTTYETLWAANTAQAMLLSLTNSDATIGTSANPSLKFTAPRVRLNEFEMGDDLDDIVEQTVGFTCEFSIADAYMLRAVLTNTKASY